MTGWGLVTVKEQDESASELVPLAEAGKTTEEGQDEDETLYSGLDMAVSIQMKM